MKPTKIAERLYHGIVNRIYYRLAPHRIKPKLLVFEVTRRCNSKCLHCKIWKNSEPKAELNCKQLDAILSDSLFSELEKVILTGGEPVLRDDLFDLIDVFRLHNPMVKVWISTNGLLPNKVVDVIEQCIDKGVNFGVGVSLDGLENEHNIVRGVDEAFSKAALLLDTLRTLGVNPTVGFTLSKITAKNYYPLKLWAKGKFPLLVQKFDSSDYYNTSKEMAEVSNAEKVVVRDLPDSLLKRYWLSDEGWRCYALHSFFVLHCNGDVSPCLRCYDMIVGNMLKTKPSKLWKKVNKARKAVADCSNQCLNDWAFNESVKAAYFPLFWFKLKKRFE